MLAWQSWLAIARSAPMRCHASCGSRPKPTEQSRACRSFPLAVTDATIRLVWNQSINAAAAAGVTVWAPGDVWLLVPESHLQLPDGTITRTTNRAPTPRFRVSPNRAAAGASVTLDGSTSQVPEGGVLQYEWDLDGDGSFDTPPSVNPHYVASWIEPWSRLVRLRVTDPAGSRSTSTATAVRIDPADVTANHAPYGDGTAGCLGRVILRANK